MLRFGADRIFSCEEGQPPSDAELAAIIDRSVTLGQKGARAGVLCGGLFHVVDPCPSRGKAPATRRVRPLGYSVRSAQTCVESLRQSNSHQLL